MTSLDDRDAADVRADLDEARELALQRLEELISAVDSGDLIFAGAMACAAKPALQRVKSLRRDLKLMVAG